MNRRNFLERSVAVASGGPAVEVVAGFPMIVDRIRNWRNKSKEKQVLKPLRIELKKSFKMGSEKNSFYVSFDAHIGSYRGVEASQMIALYVSKNRTGRIIGNYHKMEEIPVIKSKGENPLEEPKIVEMIGDHLPLHLFRNELGIFDAKLKKNRTITSNLDSLLENARMFNVEKKEYFPVHGVDGRVIHVNYYDKVSYNCWSHLPESKVYHEKQVFADSHRTEIVMNDKREFIKRFSSIEPKVLDVLMRSSLPEYVKESMGRC